MNIREYLRQIWPSDQKRAAVLNAYRGLARPPFEFLLADVCLRGGVFADPPQDASLYQCGVLAGRRQMALEMLRLAEIDPMLVREWFETKEAKVRS